MEFTNGRKALEKTMTNTSRGTFGFFQDGDGLCRGVIVHILAGGPLLLKESANSHTHIIVPRELFKPSRDAYFSFGSYVEPEWEGDSCRCTNVWPTEFGNPNVNQAANICTDEEALWIHGFTFPEAFHIPPSV